MVTELNITKTPLTDIYTQQAILADNFYSALPANNPAVFEFDLVGFDADDNYITVTIYEYMSNAVIASGIRLIPNIDGTATLDIAPYIRDVLSNEHTSPAYSSITNQTITLDNQMIAVYIEAKDSVLNDKVGLKGTFYSPLFFYNFSIDPISPSFTSSGKTEISEYYLSDYEITPSEDVLQDFLWDFFQITKSETGYEYTMITFIYGQSFMGYSKSVTQAYKSAAGTTIISGGTALDGAMGLKSRNTFVLSTIKTIELTVNIVGLSYVDYIQVL